MAGLVKLRCDNWARDEWPVWAVLVAKPIRVALHCFVYKFKGI